MNNCYFDYAFYRCKRQNIQYVCSVFDSKQALLSAVQKEYRIGYLSDRLLLKSVDKMLHSDECFTENTLETDGFHIFNRCQNIISQARACIRNKEDVDYDELFDCLVLACWLLASKWFATEKKKPNVSLLSSPIDTRKALKQALHNEYVYAIHEYNDTVYISEAIQYLEMRYPPRNYEFEHEEAEKYLDWDLEELYDRRELEERDSTERIGLFFGLTVTSMLAEEIRREPL